LVDILLAAALLFYVYRMMKDSGTLDIFIGVLIFLVAWFVMSRVMAMKVMGTIFDKIVDFGVIALVILFQDQIKRFLTEVGSRKSLKFFRSLFSSGQSAQKEQKRWIMPVVYACMNMSKSKTGALIVVEQRTSLYEYERSGDLLNADINQRLIENIFFKNSPLHDGAMIISHNKVTAAGCILPVSHDTDIPRYLGLRHRSAVGISQASDAIAIVVSEETGNITYAHHGKLHVNLSGTELEHAISAIVESD